MRIVVMSDLCGKLPDKVPGGDLLVIAGDMARGLSDSLQFDWMESEFLKWVEGISCTKKVIMAGPGDYSLYLTPNLVKGTGKAYSYLCDTSVLIGGLKMYGTPWSLRREGDRYFQCTDVSFNYYLENVPGDVDIFVCREPFLEEGDFGSKSLADKIKESEPRLVIFGGIGRHGFYRWNGIDMVNGSLCDENFNLVNEPVVIDI